MARHPRHSRKFASDSLRQAATRDIVSRVTSPGSAMRPRHIALLAALPFAQAPTMSTTIAPATTRPTPAAPAGPTTIVIRADRVLDGKGGVITGGSVVVDGDRITRVDRTAPEAVTYDLRGLTVLPGLIDA